MTKQQPTKAVIIRSAGWNHPLKANHVLCPDGVRRNMRLNQDGETGRVTINKRTLKGCLFYVEAPSTTVESEMDYKFIPWNEQ